MAYLICLAALLAVSAANVIPGNHVAAKPELSMTIFPKFIVPGKTKKITVTCEFFHGADTESITSITIGGQKKDNPSEIENLSQATKNSQVNVLSDSLGQRNASASGSMQMSKHYSEISIELEHPKAEDARVYECAVLYKVKPNSGDIKKMSQKAEVRVEGVSLEELDERTQHLHKVIQNLKKRVTLSLLETEADIIHYVLRLSNTVGLTNDRIDITDRKLSDVLKQLEVMQSLILMLASDFELSTPFSGSRYLVGKEEKVFSIEKGHSTCKALGGYLLEVDNQAELDFVYDLIKKVDGPVDRFFTGSYKDDANQNVYLMRNSGNSAQFVRDLILRGREVVREEKCVAVIKSSGQAVGALCGMAGRYICEIPA